MDEFDLDKWLSAGIEPQHKRRDDYQDREQHQQQLGSSNSQPKSPITTPAYVTGNIAEYDEFGRRKRRKISQKPLNKSPNKSRSRNYEPRFPRPPKCYLAGRSASMSSEGSSN